MRERIADWLYIMAMAILLTMFVWTFTGSVQAAPDAQPCEAINTAGAIVVYRCEPDEGAPFLLNSMGFMVVEE